MKRLLIGIFLFLLLAGCVPPAPEWSQYYVTETDILDVLDSDRLLLIELRRDVPAGKDAGLTWWAFVTRTAIASDPKLAVEAHEVRRKLETMYGLLETLRDDEASDEEKYAAYERAQQVAPLLNEAQRLFTDAVVMVIITHLDAVQYIVEKR